MRKQKEILEYLEEAEKKVWYMRSHHCDIEEIETKRVEAVKEIEEKYPEVLKFDETDYVYWLGILGSLRWVFKEEKDFLDT